MERHSDPIEKRYFFIGGALICFAYLAWLISSNEILAFDTVIRQWAYDQRNPVLNRVVIAVTYLGNWQTVVTVGRRHCWRCRGPAALRTALCRLFRGVYCALQDHEGCFRQAEAGAGRAADRGKRLVFSQRTFYELLVCYGF